MKGENDDILFWPWKGNIRFTLVNQQSGPRRFVEKKNTLKLFSSYYLIKNNMFSNLQRLKATLVEFLGLMKHIFHQIKWRTWKLNQHS